MNVFDFVNAVTYNKEDLFQDPQAEKEYVPFIVNKALSFNQDTVLYANEMNRYQIPKQWQFDFYRYAIPKRKRYGKWQKKAPISDDVAVIQEYYKYSMSKAIEALALLTPEQVQQIKQQMDKGGKS